MGLIKAGLSSFNSTMADQWKEYYICDALTSDQLVVKGKKQENGKRTSNTKGSEDIISDGSMIVVNEGQAMIIVEDGKVAEFSAEPGIFEFDSSASPSVFEGGLGKGILNSFKTMGKRFEFGGDTGHNQRVYYFNLKELAGNKFGTSEPIMYDDYVYQSISIRFFGKATLILDDPIKLFSAIVGNVEEEFLISDYWKMQLSAEFVMYLSQAMALLAADMVKYNQITQKQVELAKYMNEVLDEDWHNARGILIERVAIESITLDPVDKDKIEKIDEMRLMSNATNAAGRMTAAAANAMESAGENEGGAMMGFAGVGMAMNQAGNQAMGMHQMAANQNSQVDVSNQPKSGTWMCSCGCENTGNFCSECGNKKPVINEWTCLCGNINSGKFCSQCGAENPHAEWMCSCGSKNTSAFCSNCGSSRKL